jgi:hypothetical protein
MHAPIDGMDIVNEEYIKKLRLTIAYSLDVTYI